MALEDKDQDYNGQLSDESFETIDTSGIVYTSKNNHMQEPKTEDNALQRKQKLAKARRIICSTDDRNKKTELARRTPEQEGTPPDFSKKMDREIDSLDRRIGRLRGQGFSDFIFDFTAAGVVRCGGRKTAPRTSTIVQFIFYFGPLRSTIIF